MNDLRGKTIFITGASRGIGREIALRCARDGAHVIITGKTVAPHAKLPGTIHSVAAEVEQAGGKALAIQLDVRDEQALLAAVNQAAQHFGGLDVLVNNANAIALGNTLDTPAKRLDLMWDVNMRATFLAAQTCIPHLKKIRQPAYPHAVAAAQSERQVVCAAPGLQHFKIRHELVYAGAGTRAGGRRHCGQ